jgi:hypothetical protein
MMDHMNPSYGRQIIYKLSKYSGAQGQQQCKVYNFTSPVQHGLGWASYPMIPLKVRTSWQNSSQEIFGQPTCDQRQQKKSNLVHRKVASPYVLTYNDGA